MMNRRMFVLVSAGAIVAASGLLSVATFSEAGQRVWRGIAADEPPADAPPLLDHRFPFPVAPTTMTLEEHARLEAEARVYTVDPYPPEEGRERTEAEQRSLDEISARLAELEPVPAARLAYFAWLEVPDCPIRFDSWGCFLREARPIPGGWALQLQAMARADAKDPWRTHIDVYNRFIEEYTLTESGGLRFIRGYPHPDDDGTPKYGRSGL